MVEAAGVEQEPQARIAVYLLQSHRDSYLLRSWQGVIRTSRFECFCTPVVSQGEQRFFGVRWSRTQTVQRGKQYILGFYFFSYFFANRSTHLFAVANMPLRSLIFIRRGARPPLEVKEEVKQFFGSFTEELFSEVGTGGTL